MNSPLTLDDFVTAHIANGLVFNDVATLANGKILEFVFDQTLSGTGEFIFTNGGLIRTPDNSVLTIEPDVLIRGGTGVVGADGASNSIVNRGTIDSDEPGQIFIEGRMGWSNEGTISASNGGSIRLGPTMTNTGTVSITGGGTLTLDGAWTNDGLITMTDSIVNLGGSLSLASLGNFQRTGGRVRLTGTLDNAPGLALDATTGDWELATGRIVGGTISADDGAQLIPTIENGVLDAVRLDSPLHVPVAASITVANGITLNATLTIQGGTAHFAAGANRIDGVADVVFVAAPAATSLLFPADNCDLTIGPGITVRGTGGHFGFVGSDSSSATVTNRGTIDADEGGTFFLRSRAAPGSNEGTLRASNGTLRTIDDWSNSGRIEVTENGSFQGDLGLALTGTSVLHLEIAAIDKFGSVSILGTASLDGVLEVELVNGFQPDIGATFVIMTHGGSTGTFSSLAGGDIGGGKQLQVSYEAANVVLEVVPE